MHVVIVVYMYVKADWSNGAVWKRPIDSPVRF